MNMMVVLAAMERVPTTLTMLMTLNNIGSEGDVS